MSDAKTKLTQDEFNELNAWTAYLLNIKESMAALEAAEKRAREFILAMSDDIIKRNESKEVLPGIIIRTTQEVDYDDAEMWSWSLEHPEYWAKFLTLNGKDAALALTPFVNRPFFDESGNKFQISPAAVYKLDSRAIQAAIGKGEVPDAPRFSVAQKESVSINVGQLLMHDALRDAVEIVHEETPVEPTKTPENGTGEEIDAVIEVTTPETKAVSDVDEPDLRDDWKSLEVYKDMVEEQAQAEADTALKKLRAEADALLDLFEAMD
jgi:hypothetical protein